MRFFSLEMKDFTAAASVHIYLDEDGEITSIENRKDKDKNTYVYQYGELIGTFAPGSKFEK